MKMTWLLLSTVIAAASSAQTKAPGASLQTVSVAPLLQHGAEALRSGDLSTAANDYTEVTRIAPAMAEAYLNLGLVRERQGKHQEAITALEKAVSLKPGIRGAHLFLGIAEYRVDLLDRAAIALQCETRLNPSDANAWMWLGVDELAAKHPDTALAALDRAALIQPEDVDILYHRGQALVLASRQNYDRMFQIAPHSWRVHQVLAQGFSEQQRDDDAAAEYRLAISLAPSEPGLHQLLATSLWKANKAPEAAEEYKEELKLDPENTTTMFQLGALLVEQSSSPEGPSLVEAAVKRNPNLPSAFYYLGRAYMKEGHDVLAIEAFNKMLTQQPSPEYEQQTYYQLFRLYRRTGQTVQYHAALQKFEKLEASQREQRTASFGKQKLNEGSSSESLLPPPLAESGPDK